MKKYIIHIEGAIDTLVIDAINMDDYSSKDWIVFHNDNQFVCKIKCSIIRYITVC